MSDFPKDGWSMADLFEPRTPPNLGAAPSRKCRRHAFAPFCVTCGRWTEMEVHDHPIVEASRCVNCRHVVDPVAIRRGRSSRRLGGDTERRIERVYGPRKVGEYGDPVDHIGVDWKWQSKATRGDKPRWLAAVLKPLWRATLPAWIVGPIERMTPYYPDHKPVVIRSYVRPGVRAEDFLFVRGHEWPFNQRSSGYWVIPGTEWLDWLGRDAEVSE